MIELLLESELELRELLDVAELLLNELLLGASELDATDVVICDEAVVTVLGDEPPPQAVNKQMISRLKMSCVSVITVGSALVLYYVTSALMKWTCASLIRRKNSQIRNSCFTRICFTLIRFFMGSCSIYSCFIYCSLIALPNNRKIFSGNRAVIFCRHRFHCKV